MAKCFRCGEEITDTSVSYCNNCGGYRRFGSMMGYSSSVSLITGFIALFIFISWASSSIIKPVMTYISAKSWHPADCIVKSSKIFDEGSVSSTEYVLKIVYSYNFEGRKHTSGNYTFIEVKSRSRQDLENILKLYPEGSRTVCYVNPTYSGQAVIDRTLKHISFGPAEYAGILIMLLLILFLIRTIKKSINPKPKDHKKRDEKTNEQ